MDRGELSREEYEQSVRALRENMREVLGAKKKYVIGEDDEQEIVENSETEEGAEG